MDLNFQKEEANINLSFFPTAQWSIKSIPASNLMLLPVRTKEKDEDRSEIAENQREAEQSKEGNQIGGNDSWDSL